MSSQEFESARDESAQCDLDTVVTGLLTQAAPFDDRQPVLEGEPSTQPLLEPLSEKLGGSPHDHSILDGVKGNWLALLQWLVVVWVLVAFLEEAIYRGFLMREIVRVLGTGRGNLVLNILVTSIVFGLSHGYQGRSGIISTGIVGVVLALIFVWSDFNLWLAVFTHGFIDTIGIALIAVEADKTIKNIIWRSEK
jgi:membrane protease YdiL (CAAX protease family)